MSTTQEYPDLYNDWPEVGDGVGKPLFTDVDPNEPPIEERDLTYASASLRTLYDTYHFRADKEILGRTWVVTDHDDQDIKMRIAEDELDEFAQLEVGVAEYSFYRDMVEQLGYIKETFPKGTLRDGFEIAAKEKIKDIAQYYTSRRMSKEPNEGRLETELYAMRDLQHMFSGIAVALHQTPDVTVGFSNTTVWYGQGNKARNDGYIAQYNLCSDEGLPDADQDTPDLDDDWPDTFHYPARLEVHVNPQRRIEFVYTPGIPTARSRHTSDSVVTEPDGTHRNYHNEALSMRIDLDPTAPAGIALDIGRSSYDGERNGRRFKRSADLVGDILEIASSGGSHEYTGFTAEMADEFPRFAQELSLQLSLQQKANTVGRRVGNVVLRTAA